MPTAWAADRDGLALRGKSPSVQLSPDTTARPVRQHGLLALLLRGISASIEGRSVAATTKRVSGAITLGLRN